jgi:Xaa-Pro aminopeptidase
MLLDRGVTETWYHSCPALVLGGTRSCLSVSGRTYVPGEGAVGPDGVISVDLSPRLYGAWGDCARTYALEGGRVTAMPADLEIAAGLEFQADLHARLADVVTPATTGAQLHAWASAEIARHGFENLDFLGNVGHSIEARREDRCFIDARATGVLGDLGMFTFEPHLRKRGGRWGFKREEIYHFTDDGLLCVL